MLYKYKWLFIAAFAGVVGFFVYKKYKKKQQVKAEAPKEGSKVSTSLVERAKEAFANVN